MASKLCPLEGHVHVTISGGVRMVLLRSSYIHSALNPTSTHLAQATKYRIRQPSFIQSSPLSHIHRMCAPLREYNKGLDAVSALTCISCGGESMFGRSMYLPQISCTVMSVGPLSRPCSHECVLNPIRARVHWRSCTAGQTMMQRVVAAPAR